MCKMKVQEFLEVNNFNFDKLTEEFGIRVKRYPAENMVVLNYDQIESPKYEPIARECRSLVLNYQGDVVSRSFDRFFNYGEGECEVDFSNAVALEKVGGCFWGCV